MIPRSSTTHSVGSHRERFSPDHIHSEYLESVSEEGDSDDDFTWKDVSDCFDKLAIIFFSLILVASVTLFLLLILLNKDDQVRESLD